MRNRVWCAGVAWIALSACSSEPATEPMEAVTQEDSAGIAITTLGLVDPPLARPVDPTPAVSIASEGPGDAWRLFRVSALAITARGDLVVANRGESELLLFGADGRLRATVGREGDGPGEFRSLMHATAAGDEILALDFLPRRVTRFAGDGAYVDDFALDASAGRPLELHWTPEGLVGASFDLPDEYEATDELSPIRRTARFTLFDERGHATRVIAEAPGPEMHMVSQQVDGGMVTSSTAPVVQHTTHHALLGHRLVVGHTARWEFTVYDLDGTARRVLRAPALTRPTTESAWRARVDARAVTLRANLGDEAASALRVLDQLAEAPRPETLPAFGRIVGGDDGRLWVAPESAPATGGITWLVVEPSSGSMEAVEVPRRFSLRVVEDGLLWGVLRDDFDVESIVAYRLPD